MNNYKPKAILTDKTHFILTEDFKYRWKMDAYDADDESIKFEIENSIIVKAGFRWDGASVPKLLRVLGFKTDGIFRGAALVHDFIYIHKGKLPSGSMVSSYNEIKGQEQYGSFSRYDADRLFGKMMKEARVGSLKRWLMTQAVMRFGWLYWKDGADVSRNFIITLIAGVILLFFILRVV